MKSALIVGRDSCIGAALVDRVKAQRVYETTRRPTVGRYVYLNLAQPIPKLPEAEVAFLCAGIKGFKECNDPLTWRVNVDGVLSVGKQLLRRGVFVVYVSTGAVEWSDSAYARQRAMVEIGLQAMGDPAIVRAEKFDASNAADLAEKLIAIADTRISGIHHWPGHETSSPALVAA